MHELLEKAEEELEEVLERKYKLSVALSVHPEISYSFDDEPDLMLNPEESRHYGEANAKLYSLLLRNSLSEFHGSIYLFEANCEDEDYSFENDQKKHAAYEKRTDLEERYKDLEDEIVELSRLSAENFDLAVFGSNTVLEPATTTPLNSLAD